MNATQTFLTHLWDPILSMFPGIPILLNQLDDSVKTFMASSSSNSTFIISSTLSSILSHLPSIPDASNSFQRDLFRLSHILNWTEPFLLVLLSIHVLFLGSLIYSRNNSNSLIRQFLIISKGLLFWFKERIQGFWNLPHDSIWKRAKERLPFSFPFFQ